MLVKFIFNKYKGKARYLADVIIIVFIISGRLYGGRWKVQHLTTSLEVFKETNILPKVEPELTSAAVSAPSEHTISSIYTRSGRCYS